MLLKFLQLWASVVFITITIRVSHNLFYFNNLFLSMNESKFWYKWIHHCTWKFALNRPDTVRCPADLLQRRTVPGRSSVDFFKYRRRPAPVRYVTTQGKILKSSNARAIIKFAGDVQSVKSYDVSFICDHSVRQAIQNVGILFTLYHVLSKCRQKGAVTLKRMIEHMSCVWKIHMWELMTVNITDFPLWTVPVPSFTS